VLSIQPTSNTPIYQQIVDQVKEGVLKGTLPPGDRLPSVRELAATVTINPNTIQKAYQELERQGIIETVRGRGTFVVQGYQGSQDEGKVQALKEHLKKGLVQAHYLGLSPPEILHIVSELLSDLKASGREGNC
jgi:GntR family transcriptional regulator